MRTVGIVVARAILASMCYKIVALVGGARHTITGIVGGVSLATTTLITLRVLAVAGTQAHAIDTHRRLTIRANNLRTVGIVVARANLASMCYKIVALVGRARHAITGIVGRIQLATEPLTTVRALAIART